MENQPSKGDRFEVFLIRLANAPAAATFEEAYRQICETLNGVEDELTSIPYDPSNWQTDGRMYPPGLDNLREVEGRPAVKRLRSRRHNSLIGANGSIEIQVLPTREVVFTKPGTDGRRIGEL